MQKINMDIFGIGSNFLSRMWSPQRAFNWQLLLPNIIGNIDGFNVSQYCQAISFGDYSMDQLSEMRYASKKRFYAGLQSIDAVTLTFVKPILGFVYDYFEEWWKLIIDEDGFYYPKNNYKKTCYVALFDRTGIEVSRFTLKGVFPIARPPMDNLDYANDDIVRLVIKLSVDTIEESFIGERNE
jgi:hypothetical protein